MTISWICNIVAFICVCVLFYKFRKVLRLLRNRREMYDELYKDFTESEQENAKYSLENRGLKSKVAEFELTIEHLDSSSGMDSIEDYKDKICAITESYERQANCTVRRLATYLKSTGRIVKVEL